jgi:hypothetical protein
VRKAIWKCFLSRCPKYYIYNFAKYLYADK